MELDLDEISSGRRAPESGTGEAGGGGGGEEAPSGARLTAAPSFDLEAFARDVMEPAPEPVESETRPVSDSTKTAPPPSAETEKDARSPLHDELSEYLDAHDFKSALIVAEQILADDPQDAHAKQASLRCQTGLEEVYLKRLGPLAQIATVAVPARDIPSLALDHRSGFILALVDGLSTLDMILDMSSMRRLDTLRVLLDLVQQGILTLS